MAKKPPRKPKNSRQGKKARALRDMKRRARNQKRTTRGTTRKINEFIESVTGMRDGDDSGDSPVQFNDAIKDILSTDSANFPNVRLPTNPDEYESYLRSTFPNDGENEWAQSYDNDQLLMTRHEAVRRHVRDAVETYLIHCSIDKRNVGVIFDSSKDRGDEYDLVSAFRSIEAVGENIERGYAAFMQTLRAAQIFAFPVWFFDTALKQWRVKVAESISKDLAFPFTGKNEFDMMKWYDQLFKSDLTEEQRLDFLKELSDRNWKHNATYNFPDEMPFQTMFVGLERDQSRVTSNHGFLLYQRQRDQKHACTEWGVPTSAFPPDLDSPVPLDLIYIDGILWDGSRHYLSGVRPGEKRLHLDVIWALCSGYVISHKHCPAGVMFRRIPMAVPLYLKWENGEPMFLHGDETGDEIGLPRTPWIQPDNHHAPTLQSVITAIDEHRVIKERFTMKHRKKRNSTNKKNRSKSGEDTPEITHKNYQRVQMSQSVEVDVGSVPTQSNGMLQIPKWKLNHQIAIRSHERVRVHRGLKPMSDTDRKWLVEHDYRVYEDPRDITRKDHQRLKFRKQASADHTHWVALKHTRVKEHQRGPEDSPLIKVVRIPDGAVASGSLIDDLTHGEGP